ncbi:MAG: periplasmic heavy metal sensor [Verrucomicrobiae bacterium]|nr:periplasmic heavy metal sensor [Verrucomicrobiae bacterium]
MNRTAWVLSAAAIAAVVSVSITLLLGHRHSGNSEAELHTWMHENLNLSAEQDGILHPLEQVFEKRRLKLHEEIEQAGNQLGAALRKGDLQSQEAQDALSHLDRLQADLRRATLEHFFVMKDHLDPAQSEKLLEWVAESISPHEHRN